MSTTTKAAAHTVEEFSQVALRRTDLRAEYLGRFLGLADCAKRPAYKPDYILKTLIEIADEYDRQQKALGGQ